MFLGTLCRISVTLSQERDSVWERCTEKGFSETLGILESKLKVKFVYVSLKKEKLSGNMADIVNVTGRGKNYFL